jgi:hypothetical protein
MFTAFLSSALAAVAMSAGPTIKVEPQQVQRGRSVRVHGAIPGCPAPGAVTLISRAFSHAHDFAGLPAIYARLGNESVYSIRATIPATRKPGRYTITGRCGGGNLGVSAALRITR